MFREIRVRERMSEQDEKKEFGYMKIKPEREMSEDECNAIIMEIFEQARLEAMAN